MEKCLRYRGIYRRPHEKRDGQLWCPISEAPMSTSFAISRFLVRWLSCGVQWALFCDWCDMLWLADPAELFALADDRYAVQVVKREHVPDEDLKMDDQAQTVYPRKNWSSLILWNLWHPANERLTLDMVNTLPGRDLHRFCWLEDAEIGSCRWRGTIWSASTRVKRRNCCISRAGARKSALTAPMRTCGGTSSRSWMRAGRGYRREGLRLRYRAS